MKQLAIYTAVVAAIPLTAMGDDRFYVGANLERSKLQSSSDIVQEAYKEHLGGGFGNFFQPAIDEAIQEHLYENFEELYDERDKFRARIAGYQNDIDGFPAKEEEALSKIAESETAIKEYESKAKEDVLGTFIDEESLTTGGDSRAETVYGTNPWDELHQQSWPALTPEEIEALKGKDPIDNVAYNREGVGHRHIMHEGKEYVLYDFRPDGVASPRRYLFAKDASGAYFEVNASGGLFKRHPDGTFERLERSRADERTHEMAVYDVGERATLLPTRDLRHELTDGLFNGISEERLTELDSTYYPGAKQEFPVLYEEFQKEFKPGHDALLMANQKDLGALDVLREAHEVFQKELQTAQNGLQAVQTEIQEVKNDLETRTHEHVHGIKVMPEGNISSDTGVRIHFGRHITDNFSIEAGLKTPRKFKSNGGFSNQYVIPLLSKDALLRDDFEFTHDVSYKRETSVKSIDLVGKYRVPNEKISIIMSAGAHVSNVRDSVETTSRMSVLSDMSYSTNLTRTESGIGPLIGASVEYKGFYASYTYANRIGGSKDYSTSDMSLGYRINF